MACHGVFPSVRLVPVTRENYLAAIKLCVLPEQDKWLPTVEGTMADALFDDHIQLRLVTYLDRPVGFFAWRWQIDGGPIERYTKKEGPTYTILHLRIAHEYQNSSFGYATLKTWITCFAHSFRAHVAFHADNKVALRLYTSVGFKVGDADASGKYHGELLWDIDRN